jgi:hypothetical protein
MVHKRPLTPVLFRPSFEQRPELFRLGGIKCKPDNHRLLLRQALFEGLLLIRVHDHTVAVRKRGRERQLHHNSMTFPTALRYPNTVC